MITRADYMTGRASHSAYYGQIAERAGITFDNSPLLPEVIGALKGGDEHLNTIPLIRWDMRAEAVKGPLHRAFKEAGDYYTLAGGVCALKESARRSALKNWPDGLPPVTKEARRKALLRDIAEAKARGHWADMGRLHAQLSLIDAEGGTL